MTFHDLVTNSTGNLRRMKLRSILTITGVVIAIATFVAMLSFGAGMQENISAEFEKFGLLNTLQVYPPRAEDNSDSAGARVLLDQQTIRTFAAIPGVRLVYPFDDFNVTVRAGDSTVSTRAQSLPVAAVQTPLYSKILAGTVFTADTSDEIVISDDLLESIGVSDPDSVLGESLIVSVKVTCLDSGIVNAVRELPKRLRDRLSGVWRDSLSYPKFWADVGREEGGAALSRFIDGYLNHRELVSDTLRVGGVLEGRRHGRSKIEPVVLPAGTAARFRSSGFSDDPTDIMAAIANGTLFTAAGRDGGKEYPQVTVDLDPNVTYEPIRDSIRALGFRTFSYADEFKEMRRFFFFFKLGLSAVGLIALITASLGIVNTMVMSIIERTREIGVLKSLGADDRDIRVLFLAESGMIGSIGAVFGIAVGWLITRVAYLVAYMILQQKDLPPMPFDPFSLPWWLILTAFAFGLVVSLLAGLYPAARASRVDPVEALRSN